MLDLDKIEENFNKKLNNTTSQDFFQWLMKERYDIEVGLGYATELPSISETLIISSSLCLSNSSCTISVEKQKSIYLAA